MLNAEWAGEEIFIATPPSPPCCLHPSQEKEQDDDEEINDLNRAGSEDAPLPAQAGKGGHSAVPALKLGQVRRVAASSTHTAWHA